MVSTTRWLRLGTSVACIAALALVGSGCGSSDSSSTSTSTGTATTASASSGDCTPKHEFKTIKSGTLKVATFTSMPHSGVDGGKFTGINGDVVNAIAKMECLKVDVQELAGPALLPALQTGRVDMSAAGWLSTAERCQQVSCTPSMYLNHPAVLSKGGTVSAVDQLKSQTVGVVQGGTYVEPLQKLIGEQKVRLYQSYDALWQDIRAGRLKLAVGGAVELGYMAAQYRDLGMKAVPMVPSEKYPLSVKPLGVTLISKKDNTALDTALSEDVTALIDGGQMTEILTKYGVKVSG